MRYFAIALMTLFASASCERMMPEKKDPTEEELVTPEEKEALEKFGGRLPEA